MTAVLPETPDSRRSVLRALPIPDTEPRPDREPYLVARVGSAASGDAVLPRLRRPLDTGYYISGPPAMLAGIARDLRARNIPPEAIHIDAWE